MLTYPNWPVPAALSPVVLSQMSNPDCSVLAVLPWFHVLVVLS
jgi:hypothetical protein